MPKTLQNGIDPTAHANGAQPAAVSGQIYAAIHGGYQQLNKLVLAKSDAETRVAQGKAALYTKMAQTAYDGAWKDADIKAQVTALRSVLNGGKNYLNEIAKVTRDDVRFHVPAFFTLAKDAFAADKDTMIKAHRREIFYVLNYLIPETIAAKTDATRIVPANVQEAIAAAKARLANPDAQLAADFEAIERMAKALVAMGKRYEGAGLGAVAATLAGVTKGALDIARKKAAITEHQVNEQTETIATARAQRNAPTKLPVAPPTATPLPGAIDIEALMAGMASMQQQIAALVAVNAPKARASK